MAKRDDWQGNDWDDAPDYIRERMQRLQRRRGFNLLDLLNGLGVIGVIATASYLLYEHGPLGQWLSPPPPVASIPEPLPEVVDPYPIPQDLEPIKPSPTTLQSSKPQPLSDCIEADKVIDESVVRCRYGELPRSAPAEQPQGMVSAQYLARYREDQQAGASSSRGSAAQVDSDIHWVPKWDGGGSYQAAWRVRDNRIDYSSVCGNHRRGSIDYRECRKGAKQFFKDQCQAWVARWDENGEAWSKRMQQRYCSAGNGFSPMG